MSEPRTYKKIEIVGTSETSISDAVQSGLDKAAQTLRHMNWFEVTEIRGAFVENKPVYQVTMKVGFRLE